MNDPSRKKAAMPEKGGMAPGLSDEVRLMSRRGLFGRTSARMMESEFVAGAMIAVAPGLKPQGREGNRPA